MTLYMDVMLHIPDLLEFSNFPGYILRPPYLWRQLPDKCIRKLGSLLMASVAAFRGGVVAAALEIGHRCMALAGLAFTVWKLVLNS